MSRILRRLARTELITVAEARALVERAVRPLPAEPVELGRALGRVLAEVVEADRDGPPFASSAMDGFAIVAGPARELTIVGESRAGHPAVSAPSDGEAIRISTGAPIPPHADTVVPIERVEVDGDRVRVPETQVGANVRGAGEDVRAGELVLDAGTALGPSQLAVLASLGRGEARCHARPRVAVVVTGDELVDPGAPAGGAQIYDSNTTALAAGALSAGATIVECRRVRDELDETTKAIGVALDAADVVCISGGVSVGEHDHVKQALENLGVAEIF